MDRRRVGNRAEQAVERRLRRDGWTVRGRNARVAGVEIDIVAEKTGRVVLWEVKHRRTDDHPALSASQRRRLHAAAEAYAARHSPVAVGLGLAVVEGRGWWPRIVLERDGLVDVDGGL